MGAMVQVGLECLTVHLVGVCKCAAGLREFTDMAIAMRRQL